MIGFVNNIIEPEIQPQKDCISGLEPVTLLNHSAEGNIALECTIPRISQSPGSQRTADAKQWNGPRRLARKGSTMKDELKRPKAGVTWNSDLG